MILGFFKNILIGPEATWSSPTDYDRMRAACESCIRRIPSVNLLNRYRGCSDSEYKLVIEYFGADYLSALLQCDYFDTFATMTELVEYIKEDTEQSRFTPTDVYQTAALCLPTTRDSLYQAIMSSCSPDLRFILGFANDNPNNSVPYGVDIFVVLDDIQAMKGKGGYLEATRQVHGVIEVPYQDTDAFYEYVQAMVQTQAESSSGKEPKEWWKRVHSLTARNFDQVHELKHFLEKNQICNCRS